MDLNRQVLFGDSVSIACFIQFDKAIVCSCSAMGQSIHNSVVFNRNSGATDDDSGTMLIVCFLIVIIRV